MSSQGFSAPQQTWDQRFAQEHYIFGTEPNAYLASQAKVLQPGQRALAVADGEGRNSVWLAQQGLIVDAFDISPVAVEKARRLALENNVQVNFSISGCEDWPWVAQRYDIVAAIFVQFAAPATRSRLFENMLATLKPGGLLILQGYTPRQLEYKTGGPPLLDHLYTEEMLRAAFARHDILELKLYEAELREGTQHAGWSALAGMVVRKSS